MPVPMRAIAVDQRPRERLLALGPGALSDAELVAIILGTGRRGGSAVDLAQALLSSLRGVNGLASAFPEELSRMSGVGPAKAARIAAAFELARRGGTAPPQTKLTSSSVVASIASPVLGDQRRECVAVLVADAQNKLRRIETVSLGSMDHAHLPVREVLAAVLRHDGRAFAVAHNHPSGDPTPSDADRQATQALRAAAEATGLRFLDHVVVAGTRWVSAT